MEAGIFGLKPSFRGKYTWSLKSFSPSASSYYTYLQYLYITPPSPCSSALYVTHLHLSKIASFLQNMEVTSLLNF